MTVSHFLPFLPWSNRSVISSTGNGDKQNHHEAAGAKKVEENVRDTLLREHDPQIGFGEVQKQQVDGVVESTREVMTVAMMTMATMANSFFCERP